MLSNVQQICSDVKRCVISIVDEIIGIADTPVVYCLHL